MKIVLFCGLLLLLQVALATRPSDWVHVKRAFAHEEHTVVFATNPKPGAVEVGDQILRDIHDKRTPRYGKHLSVEEIEQIFVDKDAVAKVESFLKARNITFETRSDFIWVTASIRVLESLLNAEFHHFEHNNYPTTIFRAKFSTVPKEISNEIAIIFQTTDFPPAHEKLKRVKLQPAETPVDPRVLRQLYQVPNVALTNNNQSQGILGANGGFLMSDLTAFFHAYNTTSVGPISIVSYQKYNSTLCETIDCGEPTLDMQYIMSMAPGLPTIFFNSVQDAFVDSFNWLSSGGGIPQSFSTSVAVTGASSSYQTTLCNQAQRATLRGTTVFAASGDGAGFDANCNMDDAFPSACQYVTSVGGTQGPENNQPESVWAHSGAGASRAFSAPSWQATFAQHYYSTVSNNPVPSNLQGQRVYPDIAGVASILPLIQKGQLGYAAGTSFASPTYAGIYSQINVARYQDKKAPIGFLNNALSFLNGLGANYNPQNDITTGDSQGSCSKNLAAITGWDLGTGFGTANFPRMKFYFLQL